ncbi:MAG TPA: hypothetical protein VFV38_43610 [Ktedonobacteraceae bacterium]|nr:hypothetical protein [Ktedonobacteraceae bacterium]
MASISVSTAILREKARRIRALAEQGLTQHCLYWAQMNTTRDQMPKDLRNSHEYANNPWNQAVEAHYNNYYNLATSMEQAADLYQAHEKDVQSGFIQQ